MKDEGRFRTWYWWLILGAAVVVALGIGLMVGTVREAPREALAPAEGFTLADVVPALPEEAAALVLPEALGLEGSEFMGPGGIVDIDLGDLGFISFSDLEAFLAEGSERAVVPTLESLGELDFPGYNPLDIVEYVDLGSYYDLTWEVAGITEGQGFAITEGLGIEDYN